MSKDPNPKPEIQYVPVPQGHYPYRDDDDEIDLLELVKKIWKGRFTIIKTVVVFVALGLIVALGSPETFTSEVKLLPEAQQQRSLGSLGGLARQFGVGGAATTSADGIPPGIYPDLIRSTSFIRELLNTEVPLPDGSGRVTYQEYLTDHQEGSWYGTLQKYTIRLPFTFLSVVRSLISSDEEESIVVQAGNGSVDGQREILRLSRDEWEMIRNLRDQINISSSMDTGILTISVKFEDPVIASELAHRVVELLSETITEYRTEKARRDVEFIEERYEEAKTRFEEAQQELAQFNDENRGQLTAVARTREQVLQSNFNLTFNLYNSMAERLEEARIKLQEETPVVNILEPAAVPDRRSSPKRGQLLVILTIFGGVLGTGLIFLIEIWKNIKVRILTED